MLTKLDGLQNPDAFWGWLSAMTANYCRNVLTRGRHEVQIPEDDEGHSLLDTFENLDDQTVPDKALDNDETRRMVVDLVDQLPPSQRQCVLMFYYEEMSVKDIAAALETSEGTIKSRLNYARKAIKAGVEQYAAQGIKLYGAVPFLLYFLQKDALLGGLNASASQALAHTVLAGAAGTAAGITAAAGTTALGSTVSGSIGGGAAAAGTTTAVESAAGVSAASAGSVAAGGGAASAGGGAAHALGGILAHKGALGLAGIILAGAVTGGIVLHQAAPAPVSVVEEAFDTGGNLGAAIDAEGMLWAWGDSGDGELGSQVPPGGPGAHSDTPILVLEDTYAVACGLSHLAAIKTDGTLWTWGNNEYGQLGTGDMGKQSYLDEWNLIEHTYSDAPLQVLDQVAAISASQYTTAAVRRDGSLWMAGGNGNGQFGNGTSEGSDVFVQVMDSGVKDVACGNNYTLILKTDGSLWACGDNTYGQLGDGTQNPSLQPIQIMLDVAEIDTGGFVSAAVKTDGTLWTWGLNYYEALGFGKGGNLQDEHGYLQAVPVQVMDNVSAVITTDASSVFMSLIEVSSEKGVPVLGMPSDPRAVMDTEGTGEVYPYTFLTGQCNAPQQAAIIAQYVAENSEMTKAALFYDQSNAYAVAYMDGFRELWTSLGGEIVIEETCNATDQDFSTQLSKIKASGAEFICTPNPTAQLVIMVQQAAQLGLNIPYVGAQDMSDPFLSLLENPSVVTKAYFQSSVYMEDPALEAFCTNYEARFGEPATIKAVNGYDTMYILAEAIEQAGSADREAIKEALETSINGLDLLCTDNYVQDGKTHSPDGLGMAVYEITDGVMEYKTYLQP